MPGAILNRCPIGQNAPVSKVQCQAAPVSLHVPEVPAHRRACHRRSQFRGEGESLSFPNDRHELEAGNFFGSHLVRSCISSRVCLGVQEAVLPKWEARA